MKLISKCLILASLVGSSVAFAKVEGMDCEVGKPALNDVLMNVLNEATPQSHRFVALGLALPHAADACGQGATRMKATFERVAQ